MATVSGTSGNDTLNGTSGNDTLNGLGGNDLLVASGGTDFYDGGAGFDTLDVRATLTGVVVNFSDASISGGFSGTFVNMERVLGGNGGDSLIGAAGAQEFSGRKGNDTLAGGAGNDVLWGGGDADTFIFRESGAANADQIADFASGSDKIVLDASAMAALGASGNFAAGDGRFAANSTGTSQDASDRVIFNTTTKQLFYDADGNGSGAAVLIATLQTGATLAATDIVVENGGSPSGGQTINGTSGDDSLVGTDGDDTINGFGGDDTLRGLDGNDSLSGGGAILRDVLDGGDGDDTLIGGTGDNEYYGRAGNDVFLGDSGFDEEYFFPGEGNDWVETGADGERNVVYFGPVFPDLDDSAEYGSDTLLGGAGYDELSFYLRSAVSVDMRAGTLSGGSQSGGGRVTFSDFDSFAFWGDYSVYFEAADTGVSVFGDGGDDTLIGGTGDDHLSGAGGRNVLIGGEGADGMSKWTGQGVMTVIFNTAPAAGSADTIFSFETGVDSLHFDASVFTAVGAGGNFSAGDERFHAAPGASQGHDSTDRLIYNSSNGDLWYDADGNGPGPASLVAELPRDNGNGGDPWTVAATDIWVDGPAGLTINGTSGSDTLQGGTGNDTLNGLGSNDTLVGSGGTDFYDGGAGSDTLDVRATMTGVTVNFASGTISRGFSGTFANIERILGGNGGDSLIGAGGAQTLSSRMGDDTLAGGVGVDTLWGGGGADTFVFREMGIANADRVSDFASGSDKLHLDDAAFTAIGAMGNFAAADARFKANSGGTATDTSDRVVFNTSTGQLYYDADGSGSGAAPQLIATVQAGATVAANDIVVI